MSIEKCNRCDRMIDTDFDCEVYREEFDNEVICDTCYEKMDEVIADICRRAHENQL